MNNRLFKIKDGYKLELQTPETMKLFGSTKKKKIKNKIKNGENVPSLEIKQFQFGVIQYIINIHKSEVLYTFTPNTSYTYLLNIQPSNLGNLVFLKT